LQALKPLPKIIILLRLVKSGSVPIWNHFPKCKTLLNLNSNINGINDVYDFNWLCFACVEFQYILYDVRASLSLKRLRRFDLKYFQLVGKHRTAKSC